MALFDRLFGKTKTVVGISPQNNSTSSNQSVIPEITNKNTIFDPTPINLRAFKHAVLRNWTGGPADSVKKCKCGFYQRNHICPHIYMKALDDGLFRDVFNRGTVLDQMVGSLSYGAFAAFSDSLYDGYYDQIRPLTKIRGYEPELVDAGLIHLEDDGFRYSQTVKENLFYALHLFLSDMRAPIKQSVVKRQSRMEEREKVRDAHKRSLRSPSKQMMAFEEVFFDKCYRSYEKIMDMEEPDTNDPKKHIAYFEKRMKMVDELEQFCSEQKGGKEYFDHEYGLLRHEIQWELDDYMEDQYPTDLKYFEAEQAEKKLVNGMKSRIKKQIKAAGSIKATDLKKMFPEEEQKLYAKALREMEKSDAVIKGKDGSRVVYSLKD